MNTHIDLSRYWYIFRGGIAAPFFSWFGVFLVVMVFYTLNASAQMMGDIVWQSAAFFATGWWTTIFGGAVSVGGASLTLMPLLLTGVVMYASYQSWRGRDLETWFDVLAAALSWPAVIAVLSLAGRAPGDWWFALIGSFILAGLTAMWSARETLLYCLPWWSYVDRAWKYARWLSFFMLGAACGVTLLFILIRIGTISEIHGYYLTGVTGTIGLILLQLVYFPALVVWFFSWLVGAGFAVGTGTNFSIFGVESGPLPAIPVFGALPAPGEKMLWLFIVLVVLACLSGVVVARKLVPTTTLSTQLVDATLAVVLSALVVSIMSFMALGAIGPGRMAETGPVPALTAAFTLMSIGLPFLLGVGLSHPTTLGFVKEHVRRDTTKPVLPDEAAESSAEKGEVSHD
ncbi:hypothetical protein SAMN04489737_0947 [Arcanobacterium phocae]|uniref:Uncharacterized protein n=1 Tax=Arcanobacterium phocae TaxID=131112 RepID=A0A1H2LGB2_9ACTO|nr:DUF6350 family protein [Arcanobacterium phocae]SDU79621.1 hypothetical protein SAMN04489737_0947 [Arcanobacterium phocae]